MDDKYVSEIDCLDKLMVAWSEAFPKDWYFNYDGVISTEDWDSCGKKVLFVLKEKQMKQSKILSTLLIGLLR
ncbi:hypothetical protein ACP757_11060 [Vibrio cholerae]